MRPAKAAVNEAAPWRAETCRKHSHLPTASRGSKRSSKLRDTPGDVNSKWRSVLRTGSVRQRVQHVGDPVGHPVDADREQVALAMLDAAFRGREDLQVAARAVHRGVDGLAR